MDYWSAADLVRQICGELGLENPADITSTDDKQAIQVLAFLNAAGNDLITYYPWEQFIEQFTITTVDGQAGYDLPDDWCYFVDQTQWDQTNHWPLLGPKSPQEWAWLKGGFVATAPRMRYRVMDDQIAIHPTPGATPFTLNMEYIKKNWITKADTTEVSMITAGGDTVNFYPWLIMKLTKLKFYELKGFDTTSVTADFLRTFQSMTGKSKGGQKLSLSPRFPPLFIGPWSIPDGSWDVSP